MKVRFLDQVSELHLCGLSGLLPHICEQPVLTSVSAARLSYERNSSASIFNDDSLCVSGVHSSKHRQETTFVYEFHALIRHVRSLLPSPTVVSHINGMGSRQQTDRRTDRQTGRERGRLSG